MSAQPVLPDVAAPVRQVPGADRRAAPAHRHRIGSRRDG